MPIGEYKDFAACVRANSDKADPEAYCAAIEKKVKKKMEESQKFKRYRIDGTALKEGVSRNGNKYTSKHIMENSGKEVKIFVGDSHESVDKNVVGKVNLFKEGNVLNYEGWIMNTEAHPDAVEKAKAGLLDVSITAEALDGEAESIDIRNLHLVANPGVEGANVRRVFAESFQITESKDKKEMKSKLADEEEEESNKKKKKLEDKKMSDERMKKMESELSQFKESYKNDLIAQIREYNPQLTEAELVKESLDMLKVRRSYEKKLAESENAAPSEEKKEEAAEQPNEAPAENEEGDSAAVVEPAEEAKEDLKESYHVNKQGHFTMTESAYKKFNEEIRSRIRG